jgi:hypothetical protein
MELIRDRFLENSSHSTDINEHLPILYRYSKECSHITEFGVRWVSSTWAFLYSNPYKLISYDIYRDNNLDDVVLLSEQYNINFEFKLGDTLKVNIEETDLLFIDTLHTYNQLLLELRRHSKKVSKYIILHDTVTFGFADEIIYGHASDIILNSPKTKEGLIPAYSDFLLTDEGQNWGIHEVFTNNNGLTVLKRN